MAREKAIIATAAIVALAMLPVVAEKADLVAKIKPSRYEGTYQVGPGHFIRIYRDSPSSLTSFDTESGQIRILLPRSEADFVCGPGLKTNPVEAAIHFTTNDLGQVTALQWKPENAPAMAGTRIKPLQTEDVSFTNGNVKLFGTLVLPRTKGPHPALVIVYGSGAWAASRGDNLYADLFALNGVAALVYDKRGCGRSTGDWTKSSYDDLAGDALAGLERLKNQPGINPHQVGLWGLSEGGWIVPLAASRSRDVAFIISVSGPGVTPETAGAYAVESWMKARGYSRADVNEAHWLFFLNSRYMRTGGGSEELEAARKADHNEPWYNAFLDSFLNPYLNSCHPAQWQLISDYDPVPALSNVHCPVLAVEGALDSHLPPAKSADIWKAALAKAGNHDVVIKIFPNAEHGVDDPRTNLPLPGLLTLQRDWLLKHVTVND